MPPRRLQGFHYSAGTWAAAGNRFTKLRVVPPLPVGAYRSKISGVPLTGGQASGQVPGYPAVSGSATSPAAFAVITPITVASAGGAYTVNWTVSLSGTIGAAEVNNFFLFLDNTQIAQSVNPAAAGTYPQAPVPVTMNPGDDLIILAGPSNATAGAVYSGTIKQASGSLTLSVGPQGLGTAWYPAQVTLSTTTGVLDSSTATVYLGVGGVPTNQVGSVFSGNGVAALAVPAMQAGDFLFVTWVNGHAGDVASMNVIGTMDALTTGRG
jgi:hypothetical protein